MNSSGFTLTQIIYNISSLIAGIGSAALGLLVYFKDRKRELNKRFLFMSLPIALWGCSLFLWGISTTPPIALLWAKVLHLGATFIFCTNFHFVTELLGITREKRKIILTGYVISIIIAFTTPTNLFIKGVEDRFLFKLWPVPGVIYPLFLLLFFIYITYAIYLVFRAFKKSEGFIHQQLKYVFLGLMIALIGGSTNYPLFYNIRIIPVGNAFVFLYILIYAYAIIKYRLMDIRIAFTRAGIFLVVYTFVLGIPFVVLHRTGSGMVATSLAVVFATAGPIIYRFLQKKAEAIVLAKQRNYQRILLQAATTMVTEHNLLKLSRLIVYILKRTIDLKFTTIFVKDNRSKTYPLMAMRGAIDPQIRDTILNEEHPFISYLKKNHEPFFSEEMPPNIRSSLNLPLEIRIVLPAFAGDELLAFVLLGDKVSTESYTSEDIDVFKILSRQATLAIQNCVFFEESKESQERMFSAEKLASIGGMADGLAHQIKNRLNQFSLAGGELKLEIEDFISKHDKLINSDPELDKTFKYLKDISNSLLDNVKRTDGVIKGILDFAKVEEKGNFFAPFSLKEVVDLSTNLLIVKHETSTIPLSVKIDNEETVFGVKSQLTEVIYNLLDNAYEATKEKKMQLKDNESQDFIPAIELRLTHASGHNEIRVSDNGIGIKDEDKHKIFAPFFTTKTSYKSGSGIGVYVVKRIVEENHKGKIRFTSTYMKGTEFIIELPKN
jgi:signal transduction histidine kinase